MLRIEEKPKTLVDIVEEKLRNYIKDNNIEIGDSIPPELELAKALGVARSVLREAISRLKMLGMIQSRTRKGMTLCEPNLSSAMERVLSPHLMTTQTIKNIIGMRIAMEIGSANFIFENVTDLDIAELEDIVKKERSSHNLDDYKHGSKFHFKLYTISGNSTLIEFQKLFYPLCSIALKKMSAEKVLEYRRSNIVSHYDILKSIKIKDISLFQRLMHKHLKVYFDFILADNNS